MLNVVFHLADSSCKYVTFSSSQLRHTVNLRYILIGVRQMAPGVAMMPRITDMITRPINLTPRLGYFQKINLGNVQNKSIGRLTNTWRSAVNIITPVRILLDRNHLPIVVIIVWPTSPWLLPTVCKYYYHYV